ncbi:FAD dependent oxidoreductase [Xylona heveae TC161]|uniref:FAD dependent oxidoreductase n=1 Tax=Xylona heveae (strain CBS 132557 / TC161) TaxID=1328760 RepID=A0A161TKV1_XYLHT|nr:FAD dependent oxidoreductase [Xylona heveae TC161]KZF25880.1 FAD dependent oxidoreductase [Xylona heveae TC161]
MTAPDFFPHPEPTQSYWLTHEDDLANHRTTEELPQEADYVVIGSGYAGTTSAYYLLKDEKFRPSTVILEARSACSGATARNGGHLKPDCYLSFWTYAKMFGPRTAAQLINHEIKHLKEIKKLVEEENIDCDFHLTRAIDVFLDERVSVPTIQAYREMVKAGYLDTSDIEFWANPKEAEQVSGMKDALCAFSFTAGHIWPYKFIMHLLRRAVEWGANLQTNTPVTTLSEKPDAEGRWTVTTPRGTIRAKNVVIATNAYTAGIMPEFKDKIVPVRGIAAHIAVPEGQRPPHLNNSYAVRFGPKQYDYMVVRADGSVVVGGAKQKVLLSDSNWENVTDDSKLIEGADEYFDGYMQRHFNGWEDSGATTTKIWTGIMGYSKDFMPFLGRMPGKRGIWLNTGFTGHGMPRILLSSVALAGLMKGEVDDLSHTDIPWPFWATEERIRSTESVVQSYMAGDKHNGEKKN